MSPEKKSMLPNPAVLFTEGDDVMTPCSSWYVYDTNEGLFEEVTIERNDNSDNGHFELNCEQCCTTAAFNNML